MALGLIRPLVRHISRIDRRNAFNLYLQINYLTLNADSPDLTSVIMSYYLMTFQ